MTSFMDLFIAYGNVSGIATFHDFQGMKYGAQALHQNQNKYLSSAFTFLKNQAKRSGSFSHACYETFERMRKRCLHARDFHLSYALDLSIPGLASPKRK